MISANRPSFVEKLRPDDTDKPPIPRWSFSAIQTYEQCPYRTFLQKVKKIKEPSSPAADRGSQIHQIAEDYVNGTIESDTIPKELEKFETEFSVLREAYQNGKVFLEEDWGFNHDWDSGDWKMSDLWLLAKIDVGINASSTSMTIIDHKTGRKFGNELKHNSQLMLYAICCFMRYPRLEHVTAKLWYLDKGETTEQQYTRDQAMQFLPRWNARGLALTNAVNFPPTPSKSACRWCSYGKPNEDGELACPDVYTEL